MVMVMDGNCSLDGEQVVGCTEVERECWTHETYTVLETNVTSIKNNLKNEVVCWYYDGHSHAGEDRNRGNVLLPAGCSIEMRGTIKILTYLQQPFTNVNSASQISSWNK